MPAADARGTVYVVSGMTQRGRVERVLGALRARGHRAVHVNCGEARTSGHFPAVGDVDARDAFVVHLGGLRHAHVDFALALIRASGARRLMIHSLNLGRILAFADGHDEQHVH